MICKEKNSQQVKELTLHDALKHANKNLQNTVNELNNALNKK